MPVIQALCVTMSRATLGGGPEGLLPVDAATQVAIPEFDGRIIGGPISFKERDAADSPVGVPVPRYVADPERCDRLAQLGAQPRRLRTATRRKSRSSSPLPDQARADRDGGRARHARAARSACCTGSNRTGSTSATSPRTATR